MPAALIALAAALLAAGAVAARRRQAQGPAEVAPPTDDTELDSRGAVRSVQAAEVTMPATELERIWTARDLERLGRSYWRFLERVTLHMIRVVYGADERRVVLLFKPLTLLRFDAPEYEMDATRGRVRWRIRDGLLVDRRGRHGNGFLEIDVRRQGPAIERPGAERIRIEIEVANFYPAIATRFSAPVYRLTQSRVHVIVTSAFLRSLSHLDLAVSRVRRFDPPPPVETPQP